MILRIRKNENNSVFEEFNMSLWHQSDDTYQVFLLMVLGTGIKYFLINLGHDTNSRIYNLVIAELILYDNCAKSKT